MSQIEKTSRKQSDCVRFFVLNPLAFIFINRSTIFMILQIHTGTLNLFFQFNSITILNVKGDETQ